MENTFLYAVGRSGIKSITSIKNIYETQNLKWIFICIFKLVKITCTVLLLRVHVQNTRSFDIFIPLRNNFNVFLVSSIAYRVISLFSTIYNGIKNFGAKKIKNIFFSYNFITTIKMENWRFILPLFFFFFKDSIENSKVSKRKWNWKDIYDTEKKPPVYRNRIRFLLDKTKYL